MRLNSVAMPVWLASMRPDTRCDDGMYGDLRVSATWIEAGPQGIKVARRRSRMRRRDLWTWIFFALESEGMEAGRIKDAYVGGVGLALDDV